MEKNVTDSYSCKQDKHALSLFFVPSSILSYSYTIFSSTPVFLCSTAKSSKIPFFPTKSSFLSISHVDLSDKLGKDSKLNSNKQKHHINNNLYIYYRSKKPKVDRYPRKQPVWAYLATVAEDNTVTSEIVLEN